MCFKSTCGECQKPTWSGTHFGRVSHHSRFISSCDYQIMQDAESILTVHLLMFLWSSVASAKRQAKPNLTRGPRDPSIGSPIHDRVLHPDVHSYDDVILLLLLLLLLEH